MKNGNRLIEKLSRKSPFVKEGGEGEKRGEREERRISTAPSFRANLLQAH